MYSLFPYIFLIRSKTYIFHVKCLLREIYFVADLLATPKNKRIFVWSDFYNLGYIFHRLIMYKKCIIVSELSVDTPFKIVVMSFIKKCNNNVYLMLK